MDASTYNKEIYVSEEKFDNLYYEVFTPRIEKAISLLKGFKGTLLDIGCGDGTISLKIKNSLNCEVKGAELIQENVVKARKKGIDAKKVDLNNEKLPFKSSSIDCVFAGEILEHVIDSEKLLEEMKRVLKKKGILILTVPNTASWYNRMLLLFGYLPHFIESGSKQSYGTPFGEINGHVKAFTKRSVLEMLKGNGFKIEKSCGTGLGSTKIKKYNNGSLKILAPLFFIFEKILSHKTDLATNIVVKATK